MDEKILIIESNEALVGLWEAYLARHGFEAKHSTGRGKRPANLENWGFPDVIISGLDFAKHIPSGSEYCVQALGERPSDGRHIPVIQLFNSFIPESVRLSLEGSAFKLIAKPVSLQLLLSSVREACFEAMANALRQAGPPAMSAGLQGNSLYGMLQSIDSGKRTGTIIAESISGKAWMAFENAELAAASCGNLSGIEAALEALSWTSGAASFHENSPRIPMGNADSPSIQALLAEALRQRELVDSIGQILSAPNAMLQRLPDARIGGKAPAAEKIYIALESPCDIVSLSSKLKSLSKRQLLVALAGMLERGEIALCSGGERQSQLKPALCKAILGKLRSPERSDCIACEPQSVAVFSTAPRLAKRFIGALCDLSLARSALVSDGKRHLLVQDVTEGELIQTPPQYGGAILIFDRLDSGSLRKCKELAGKLMKIYETAFIVAVPKLAQGGLSAKPEELLGLPPNCPLAHLDFKRADCEKALASLLDRQAENSVSF